MKKLALLTFCLFLLLFVSCSKPSEMSEPSASFRSDSFFLTCSDDAGEDADECLPVSSVYVDSSAPGEEASCEVVNSSLRQYSVDATNPYVIFAAEIKNTGSCDLIFATDSSVDFLSADGTLVYTENYISIQPDVVAPGESAYVSVCTNGVLNVSDQSKIASCVLHAYYDSLRTDYQKPDVSFSDITVNDIYGYPSVIAQAENSTSDFQDVFVATAVFDESGVIVDVQIGGISIAPGEEKGFSQSGIAYVQNTSGYTASLAPYIGMFAFSSDFSDPSVLQYEKDMDTLSFSVGLSDSQDSSDGPDFSGNPGSSDGPDAASEHVSLDLPAFNGLKFSGTGDSVITDIDLPIGAIYYAYISYSGSRNFIVKVYDDFGSCDLAVNEIGSYRGFYLFIYDSVSRIEITASSTWEISIAQLTFPEDGSEITSLSGCGAYVSYIFDAPSGVWNFTHEGSHNFIVHAYRTDGTSVSKRGRSLLVNEIGVYSGDHFIDTSNGDHIVIVIEADGNWTASMVE